MVTGYSCNLRLLNMFVYLNSRPLVMRLLASITFCFGITSIMLGANDNPSEVDPEQLLKLAVIRVKENTLALNRLTCEERTFRFYYVASSSKVARSTMEQVSQQP